MKFEELLEEYSVLIDEAAEKLDEVKSIMQQNEKELAEVQRKLTNKNSLTAEEYRKAYTRNEALLEDNNFYFDRLEELKKKSPVTKETFEAFRGEVMKELKAQTAAAEQEIIEKLESVVSIAKLYTTELNKLQTVYYAAGKTLGNGYVFDLPWAEQWLPVLISEVNKLILGAYNDYINAKGKVSSAVIDYAEITQTQQKVQALGAKVDEMYLPEIFVTIPKHI